MKPPITNIHSIEKETIGNGATFSAKVGRISKTLGMKGLGCKVVDLAPNEKAWPYHLHYGHEEVFVVLHGSGTIRFDNAEHPINEGDVIYAPPGDGTAHQIINTSSGQLRYLAMSTTQSPETCYYPDSGKFISFSLDSNGPNTLFSAHESDFKSYYDGEDPSS